MKSVYNNICLEELYTLWMHYLVSQEKRQKSALEGDLFFCDHANVDETVNNSSGNSTYAKVNKHLSIAGR